MSFKKAFVLTLHPSHPEEWQSTVQNLVAKIETQSLKSEKMHIRDGRQRFGTGVGLKQLLTKLTKKKVMHLLYHGFIHFSGI